MAAQLNFVMFTGRLLGFANGKFFDIHALSGGGGGSKNPNRPSVHYDPDIINNPYMTGRRTTNQRRGGTIPRGRYFICRPAKHPHLGLSARLVPRVADFMNYRGGFYIHARGPRGSDGCIVPMEKFQELMRALSAESISSDETENGKKKDDKTKDKSKDNATSQDDICGYLIVMEHEDGWRSA